MKRIAPIVALVLLLLPAAAEAKGTNVRISSAPNGTDAGEPWTTLITITMPPKEPLVGVAPKMIIRKGSVRETFPAVRTARKGVYRATVVFPSRGEWTYGVEDGMDKFEPGIGRVHRFPPVTIAAGQSNVAKAPLPISGEISEEEIEAAENAPRGQLPPETFRVASTDDEEDSGSGAMFPALAFLIAAAVAGPVWVRRRRNNKRAT